MMQPRPEYPRPQFKRENWLNLNGKWDFAFDDADVGELGKWYAGERLDGSIAVPFCYQSKASGIGDTAYHPILWYSRNFTLSDELKRQKLLLHFGAVDYEAKVWLNGVYLGSHRGGYTPFSFNITQALQDGENQLYLRAEDVNSCTQPRGKQSWKEAPDSCWYTPTSGIWQTVWLETVGDTYFQTLRITPNIDDQQAVFECELAGNVNVTDIALDITYEGRTVYTQRSGTVGFYARLPVYIQEPDYVDDVHHWSPERPNLYDVVLTLFKNGVLMDQITTYFGMRKIHIDNGHIMLNNKPYYQRLVLDQGYWPESLMTPPSDEAIQHDILLTKKMGFNGARKHQKIEDPRYYYWADRLGLLVWGEMPSGYEFRTEEIRNLTEEWMESIHRNYNHPCIICWVPLNESWGVRNIYTNQQQRSFALALFHLTKAIDPTRLVNANDGWEQISASDLCGIHDYTLCAGSYTAKYQNKGALLQHHAQGRMLYAQGEAYTGQPIVISEFGGIVYTEKADSFGYLDPASSPETYLERLQAIVDSIRNDQAFSGFCYTQLTDVMQERNGLLTEERIPKLDVDVLAQVFQN